MNNLTFNHIGVPVKKSELTDNARYSDLFKMYSENCQNKFNLPIEYHAFDEGSSLDKRLQEQPHIAFKVDNIEKALENQEIVMPLYEPFVGYRCAAILLNNVLIELIETNLSEEKIWNDEDTLKNGILYGKK